MSRWPAPSLRHLAALTDDVGIFEHARFDEPRRDTGYCTDDAGRLLAIASRLATDPDGPRLARVSLDFLQLAHEGGSSFRLRMNRARHWCDDPPSDDAVGRALYGLGVAVARAPWPEVRAEAFELFDRAVNFRTLHPRAAAYAVIGAVEILRARPNHEGARALVEVALELLAGPEADAHWPWPARRLTYANALVPGARLVAGRALGNARIVDEALRQLDWLVREETLGDHFSFTPVAGRGPDEVKPAFDQQPIEAAAVAFACSYAYGATHEVAWAAAVGRSADWFTGRNDGGVAMFDANTYGGFDGLESHGVNRNQGAESTIAFVETMWYAYAMGRTRDSGGLIDASAFEGFEQTGDRGHGSPDAPVGRPVGQVDIVAFTVSTLDEYHLVDVADQLPLEFGFQDGIGQTTEEAPSGLVEQGDVHRVRAVPTPFVEEQQKARLGAHGRRAGADAERPGRRREQRVGPEVGHVRSPIVVVGVPEVIQVVEDGDLHVAVDPLDECHTTVVECEEDRILVLNVGRSEQLSTRLVEVEPRAIPEQAMRADAPRARTGGREVRVRDDQMVTTLMLDALDSRVLETGRATLRQDVTEFVVVTVDGGEDHDVRDVVHEARTEVGPERVTLLNGAGEQVEEAVVVEHAGVEDWSVARRVAALNNWLVSKSTNVQRRVALTVHWLQRSSYWPWSMGKAHTTITIRPQWCRANGGPR